VASSIRFTKPERHVIRSALKWYEISHPQCAHIDSITEKLDKSEQPKSTGGLSVGAAIEAFREVLGARLVVPPNPSAGWYAQLGKKLADSGISRQECVAVAKQAEATWRTGSIKAESLIRQCDVLLAESQQSIDLGDKLLVLERDNRDYMEDL